MDSQLTRIPTQPREILPKEHLPLEYLRGCFAQFLTHVYGARIRRRFCLERPRCDVVLEEFLVHDVDEGGDQRFDVFGARGEGFDVAWKTLAGEGEGRDVYVRLLKSRKEWR